MVPRIVIETNVLVSAILSPDGAAWEVLRRCPSGEARPPIGNALFPEYEDVLSETALRSTSSSASSVRCTCRFP